jgi:hypothetical protein
LRSGTSGFSSTIARGSGRGTAGTRTRPRPSLLRLELPADEPELRTDTERLVDFPDSRPDTDRRDWDDRDDVRELERAPALPEPREPLPPAVSPVGTEPTMPFAETTGASPHVSQYSSPPPTSSYDPSQPGRWHVCPA